MTEFNDLHPRQAAGRFTDKDQSAPETSLTVVDQLANVGDLVDVGDRRGQVTEITNGTYLVVYPNGDQSLETKRTATVHTAVADTISTLAVVVAIGRIRDRAATLTDQQVEDLVWTNAQTNVGAWGDLRHNAEVALIDATIFGHRDQWLDEHAATVDDLTVQQRQQLTDPHIAARTIAGRTAEAVAARHLIGQVDGWTQDGYDHLTRPWRENIGPAHPDDEARPASWDLRPAPSAGLRRAFRDDLAKINAVIIERGALIVDEEDGWTGVDEEKLGPELSRTYSGLQQYGYANGLLS